MSSIFTDITFTIPSCVRKVPLIHSRSPSYGLTLMVLQPGLTGRIPNTYSESHAVGTRCPAMAQAMATALVTITFIRAMYVNLSFWRQFVHGAAVKRSYSSYRHTYMITCSFDRKREVQPDSMKKRAVGTPVSLFVLTRDVLKLLKWPHRDVEVVALTATYDY